MKKILVVFGTRPEAIKMAPIITALRNEPKFNLRVCITGQHKEMLDQVLKIFDIKPDFDLGIMTKTQNLSNVTSSILDKLPKVLEEYMPDLVLVHGDTTTTLASTLSAYYKKIKVGHVEAGLRTHNIYSPWPEEINRRITATISEYNFSPTDQAKLNLINENVNEKNIFVTGNTVIDSLFYVKDKINSDKTLKDNLLKKFHFLKSKKKLILVTGHRRENFGAGLKNICEAIKDLSIIHSDIDIVYPVHLNPNVKGPVNELLSGKKNIYLLDPLDYISFVFLLDKAYLVITDSGGIQEEAPSFGKPVLVTRDNTERPEAIQSGTAKLVGSCKADIIKCTSNLLEDEAAYKEMSLSHNPYGEGNSSLKIINILKNEL